MLHGRNCCRLCEFADVLSVIFVVFYCSCVCVCGSRSWISCSERFKFREVNEMTDRPSFILKKRWLCFEGDTYLIFFLNLFPVLSRTKVIQTVML